MTVHLCARARGSGRPLQREHGHWGWGEPLQQWIREQGTLPLVNEMLMGKRPAVLYALLLLRIVVSWNPHSLLGVESRGPSASGPHQGKPLSWIQRCSQIGLVLVWMSCGAGSANSGTQPACGLLPFNCRSKKLRTNKQQTNKQTKPPQLQSGKHHLKGPWSKMGSQYLQLGSGRKALFSSQSPEMMSCEVQQLPATGIDDDSLGE